MFPTLSVNAAGLTRVKLLLMVMFANLHELAMLLSQMDAVVSAEVEGESPARLRIEVASEASGELVYVTLRLLGYSARRPDHRTLIVFDE